MKGKWRKKAVKGMRKGKVPREDEVVAEMLIEGWEILKEKLTKLYNGCLKWGLFPNSWMRGVIRALLKGEDKDRGLAKSYRPICLLSVLGKVFKRVVVNTLDATCYLGISDMQFGYMKGRSTVGTVIKLREVVENLSTKYAMGIFLDMTGAFDRVWWSEVLFELREKGVKGGLYRVMRDYLNGR